MEILIIIFLILFLALASFRLNWAIFLTLFSLPAYLFRFTIITIPSTLLEAMIIIVFLVWLVKDKPWKNFKKISFKKRRKYPYYLEIIAILIAAWLGLWVAGFSTGALGIFKAYFLEPIMFYIVLVNRGYINTRKFIWPLALSALVISLIAIYQQFSLGLSLETIMQTKVSSIFSYPNALGLYLGPIIMLSFGLFLAYPKRSNLLTSSKKLLLLTTIVFSFLAIFFARSEGAIIAILISFLLIAILLNKKTRKVALILVALIAIFTSLHTPTWDYIKNRATLMDLSGQIRRQQWKETTEMLTDSRFLTGAGLDNYQNALKPYHQEGIFVKDQKDPDWHRKVVWDEQYHKQAWQPVEIYLYPHNIFLNFWTEITLLGALLFVWLILRATFDLLKMLKNLNNNQKGIALGVFASLLVILIHGLVDVPYFKNDLAVLFWIIIFLTASLKLKQKKGI